MTTWWTVVQLEFTHQIGPPGGLYVVARNDTNAIDVGTADVLHLGVIGAPPPLGPVGVRLAARRRRREPYDRVREVPLSTATFAVPEAGLGADTAAAQLAAVRERTELVEDLVHDAFAVLNVAIAAYRSATWDPYVIEVAREDARMIRVGVASADQVRRGELEDGFEVAAPGQRPPPREAALQPAEHVADVLAARADVHLADVHLTRALLDLDQDRPAAAAAEVRMAAAALAGDPRLGVDERGALSAAADDLGPAPDRDAVTAAVLGMITAIEAGRQAQVR